VEAGGSNNDVVYAIARDVVGNSVARVVEWHEMGNGVWLERRSPLVLEFTLRDADLYSFRFSCKK
jgi:hypothetical protein